MKLFRCQNCGQLVYFENRSCERCGYRLAYLPRTGTMSAIDPVDGHWRALATPERTGVLCVNAEHDACNWLVPAESGERYCLACRHNGIIPDLSDFANLSAWRRMEEAKHRLVYTLLRWKLPLETRAENPAHGLIFEFLADPPDENGPKVMTGHENGVVTIALVEADDAERERRRHAMGEPYRTLIGHFRHEVGHHYWDILVRDAGKLDACRAVFGDDREDYQAALQRRYRDGPPQDWRARYVSSYAATHPWEDFAETWAHYLHIVDTLEMAYAFGLDVAPRLDETGEASAKIDFDAYVTTDLGRIMRAWIPLTFALNSVNRAMGHGDVYPFVLAPAVIGKLGFIHDLVHDRLAAAAHPTGEA